MQGIVNALQRLGAEGTLPTDMVLIGNGKTGKSLESRYESGTPCPLMKKVQNHLTAPHCPSCYAVAVLNNYEHVRDILRQDHSAQDIITKAAHYGCSKISGSPVWPGERLRLYGLTDFRPTHIPTIRMMAKIYQIDIISKTLWHFKTCRAHLIELARLPGICISLSFNKSDGLAKLGGFGSIEESIEACRSFVRKNRLGRTVSLNYTFTTQHREIGRSVMEEYRRIPGVRVYHTVSKNKGALAEAIGMQGVCGLFDEIGRPINDFSKRKGSCLGCNYCRKGTAA